ncbi:MAG: hypothetical protein AAF682_21765 [Planctomycetota bacterium]
MSGLLRLLRRLFLLVAWVLFLCAAGLIALEESGVLTDFAREKLAAELGVVGQHVHVERARLLWFEPGLVLEGVTFDGELAPDGRGPQERTWREGEERLRLSTIHVRFHPRLDPRQPIEEVEVRGGRVQLSDTLFEALQALSTTEGEPGPERRAPPVSVRGLAVRLETPGGADLPLGSADFVVEDDGTGRTRIRGRLSPTLGGAIYAPAAVHLEGEAYSDSGFALRATAHSLLVDSAGMEPGEAERLTGVSSFRGELALNLEASLGPKGDAAPRADLRLRLRDGYLELPGQLPAEELDLELDASFAPGPGMTLWEPDAWAATARARGRWNRSPVDAWALVGGDASSTALLESWVSIGGLQLDEETLRATGAEDKRDFRETFNALGPRGSVDTVVSLRLPRRSGTEGPVWTGTRELLVELHCEGDAGMTFHGWLDENDERQGVPIPCTDLRGRILFAHNSALRRPDHLAFVGMTADHGTGPVVAQGMLSAPLEGRRPDLDFQISVPTIDVGPRLAAGLEGLKATNWIWDEFGPTGGTMSGDWRLRQRHEINGLSAEGVVRLDRVGVLWKDVPVPLNEVSGELGLRWANDSSTIVDLPPIPGTGRHPAYRAVAVRWDLANQPGVGQTVRARGVARGESLPPEVQSTDISRRPAQSLQIELDGLLLRGQDWDTLSARFPEMGAQVEELRGQGSINAVFRGRRPAPDALYRYDVEVRPENVVLTPRIFGRQTQGIEGRVLISGQESPEGPEVEGEGSARFALFGAWGADVALAARGEVLPGAPATIEILGAGVDPASPTFKGALTSSLNEDADGDEVDLSAFEVDGRLDFEARVEFAAEPDVPPDATYRVFLRGNRFRSEAFRLESMQGVFVQEQDVLRSPLLRASLAGTPVELRNVLFLSLDAARDLEGADPLLKSSDLMLDEKGHVLQADWSAAGVSLDREHLSPFVDDETLDLLLNGTDLAGRIDIRNARLLVVSDNHGKDRVVFRGDVFPRGVALKAGLPIEIRTAAIGVEQLVLEAGRVRGWWRVAGLDGDIAGRRVEDAGMIMTFVDGRLTIDNLRGSFGGGRITSLGGVEQADRAIAIDLTEPYGYAIAVRLNEVRVDELLGGVFESSIEDLGRLTAWMRLRGEGGDVLALAGGGAVRVFDARLWSIPVVRELFRSLGLDASAIFDQMDMRWALDDGTLRMGDLRVRSPLLQLVGEGSLELTGEVRSDLQVRYSLVDKIGPLNRVFYWLNNSLWQVAIRGDLSRPRVSVRNSIAEFLFGFEDDPPRGLPLPGWSPLSSRF